MSDVEEVPQEIPQEEVAAEETAAAPAKGAMSIEDALQEVSAHVQSLHDSGI